MQQSFKVLVGYKIKSRQDSRKKQARPVAVKINPFDRIHEVNIDESLDTFVKESVEELKFPEDTL